VHVGVQLDRHLVHAERLDRLVELDLTLVTEPKSLPSSPTRAAKVTETSASLSAIACAAALRSFSSASRRLFSAAMRLRLPGVAW
jgi:hypothetical protein